MSRSGSGNSQSKALQLRRAQSERASYLLAGTEPVIDLSTIQGVIPNMARGKHDSLMRYSLGNAYLDLAQHPDTPSAERLTAIQKAQKHLGILSVAGKSETPDDVEKYGIGLKADLQNAYIPKITKLIKEEGLGLDDELKLYANLLLLGQSTLQQTSIIKQQPSPSSQQLYDLAGAKSELSLHMLNARSNLRGETAREAWPALERHDLGYSAKKPEEREWRTGWDMAVSNGQFWDPTSDSLKRIQVKSSAAQIDKATLPYHPDITVVRIKEDIGALAHNILEDTLTEAFQDGEPFEAAQSRLDNYQQNFTDLLA